MTEITPSRLDFLDTRVADFETAMYMPVEVNDMKMLIAAVRREIERDASPASFDSRSPQCFHCRQIVKHFSDHWRTCEGPHPAKAEIDELATQLAAVIALINQLNGLSVASEDHRLKIVDIGDKLIEIAGDPPAAAKALLDRITGLEIAATAALEQLEGLTTMYNAKPTETPVIKQLKAALQGKLHNELSNELAHHQQLIDEAWAEANRRQAVINELGRDLLERQRLQSVQAAENEDLRFMRGILVEHLEKVNKELALMLDSLAAKPAPEQVKETPRRIEDDEVDALRAYLLEKLEKKDAIEDVTPKLLNPRQS